MDFASTYSFKRWLILWMSMSGLVISLFFPLVLPEPFRTLSMKFFAPVCHQLPERSWVWHGMQMAVCHRCTGIYVGLWLGVLAFPFMVHWDTWLRVRAKGLLVLALLPAAIDWVIPWVGFWQNTWLS